MFLKGLTVVTILSTLFLSAAHASTQYFSGVHSSTEGISESADLRDVFGLDNDTFWINDAISRGGSRVVLVNLELWRGSFPFPSGVNGDWGFTYLNGTDGQPYETDISKYRYSLVPPGETDYISANLLGFNHFSVNVGDFGADADNIYLRGYDKDENLVASASDLIPLGSSLFKRLEINSTDTPMTRIEWGSTGVFPETVLFDSVSSSFTYTLPAPIPLPASSLLLMGGLVALGGLTSRRRQRA